MLGSPVGPGGTSQRGGLWPLAPAPAPTATTFSTDSLGKYGVYSLFPGGPSFGSALYSHSTIGRFASGQFQQSTGNSFHAAHKVFDDPRAFIPAPGETLFQKSSRTVREVSDSLFSSGYSTFGAPTPPPGSPYSPIPVAQLELLAKGFSANSNSVIIQQSPLQQLPEYPVIGKKIQEKSCDEKCCSLKTQKSCNCQLQSPVKGFKCSQEIGNGCSRTNPVEWGNVNVKKEPEACQVAEISTSASPLIKLEVTSPTQKGAMATTGGVYGSNIPLGIAIARQKVQQEIIASPTLPPAGLLTTVSGGAHIKEIAKISEIDSTVATGSMAANPSMGGQGGGAMIQCTEERPAGLANWQMGGAHNQALATPTLWQYPASVPMEPMVPLPVPMPPVGFQLVRDPTTGGLLLLPTTAGIEPLQQAVVWPSYAQPSSVLLPSVPPMPPPPLQLLSSTSSDYLSSSTTLHQHTQTHSTRLVAVTTDSKRKIPMPLPATTLIKIETDATLDQTKTLQAVSTVASNTGTVFTDQNLAPLVTTHVIYQHPSNLILPQTPTTAPPQIQSQNGETPSTTMICRSQATSPVSCLTPPPEVQTPEEETSMVQDASNQTDIPICSEDDATAFNIGEVGGDAKGKTEESVEKITNEPQMKSPEPSLEAEAQSPAAPEPTKIEESVSESREPEPFSTPIEEIEEIKLRPQQPDLSGLELLSNSIVEFESCRNANKTEISDITICKERENSQIDDGFGGLDLLCALAEQRILEENVQPKLERERREHKKEKRKAKKYSIDEPKHKKIKGDKHSKRKENYELIRNGECSSDSDKEKISCSCQTDKYVAYKRAKSEEEVKKFIASKSQRKCCKDDWPCMNAMELDMRIKLAELQREYREKQKELRMLKVHKHSDCSKKRSRKKSTQSKRSLTPPPLLDKIDDAPIKSMKENSLSPPILSAMPKIEDYYKMNQSDSGMSPKHSSSKKRKVGRPKRSPPGEKVATETIVAKKPKSNFVGYLLAAKEKLKLQKNKYPNATPPRYVEETCHVKPKKTKNNNHISCSEMKSKIRPTLKAEATIKTYNDEDANDSDMSLEEPEDLANDDEEEVAIEYEETNPIQLEQGANFLPSTDEEEDMVDETSLPNAKHEENQVKPEEEQVENKTEDNRCTLTSELLEVDKLRVLTAMGGLFYAGKLNALEPPDVYSITLDGERGNRPHIMSREEILRDAIVEVSPKSIDDIPVGTRICAYWSQQYRCLYPGSVAEPGTPDPHWDSKFVCVEFDDGDNGRIALEDIRLLPSNYPIIEYDPNPLLSLCKRRRRASTSVATEERIVKPPPHITVTLSAEKENKEKVSLDSHKEKKRLKKKKRDKLKQKLSHEDKKKKKKHRCADENCKHKKHKKHRKHKKHHEKKKEEKKIAVLDEIKEQDEDRYDVDEDEPMDAKDVDEEIDVEENDSEEQKEDDKFVQFKEVTIDDIVKANKSKKSKKIRDRQESCESRSKMSAFLPAKQLWSWAGKGYKRQRAKGRSKKSFYKSIQRGKETITVGDSAVFLSTGRPDRPYIGRIEAMWELCGTMVVRVKWFYHPEETIGCPQNLQYPGALFESPHIDENDVQTIAHKCEVLPLNEYKERLGDDPECYASIYDNNDIYYLAGYYDPTTHAIKMEPGIPFLKTN